MAQSNSYEEARKLRLEDNKRKFQELGVFKDGQQSIKCHQKEKQDSSEKSSEIKDNSYKP